VPLNLPKDLAEEMTTCHRVCFAELKRTWPHGRSAFVAMRTASLISLLEQGYSRSDVAAFVGVTRERTRQWLAQAGVVRHANRYGTAPRVWDDTLHAFRPISRAVSRLPNQHAWSRAVAQRRDLRALARRAKRRDLVMRARAFRLALGREPVFTEVLTHLGIGVPALASLFCGRRPWASTVGTPGRYARPVGRFLRLVGMVQRKRGETRMHSRRHAATSARARRTAS